MLPLRDLPTYLHIQIGQAFRIALTQGLHCEPAEGLLNETEANRLRCIWWTIYILDRKLSSLMGAPSSIQDSDITVSFPRSDPVTHLHKALGLHVAISQLHAKVLNSKSIFIFLFHFHPLTVF
jgi:hypothetical protein